jgi:hypothetical protein
MSWQAYLYLGVISIKVSVKTKGANGGQYKEKTYRIIIINYEKIAKRKLH